MCISVMLILAYVSFSGISGSLKLSTHHCIEVLTVTLVIGPERRISTHALIMKEAVILALISETICL